MNARPAYLSRLHHSGVSDDALGELCSLVFSSLRRSDQRKKGELYIRGLLAAEGRKSMRNIAGLVGSRAAEQSLQHFISCSTWDWRPVREALTRHLDRVVRPQAWVIKPMVIPKAGNHSVGVEPRFVSRLGQVVNSQQAYGLWFASDEMSAPVAWRLFLSGRWLGDKERRRRADIPDGIVESSIEGCACGSALDVVRINGLRRRPVILDIGDACTATARSWLAAAGLPFLARISGSSRVTVADQVVPGYSGGAIPAQRLAEAVKTLRRPIEWVDPAGPMTRTSLVVGVRVGMPEPSTPGPRMRAGCNRPLLLLAEWSGSRQLPTQFWLTDLVGVPQGALLRLTKLTRRVDKDFSEVSNTVGIKDFEGRSFQGWHRHVTLASVAHAASIIASDEPETAHYRSERSA